MTENPATLRDTDTVAHALNMLLKLRELTLPVVDDAGRYLGMFGKHRILSLLMPMLAGQDDRLPSKSRLTDYAGEDDSIGDMCRRLKDIGDDPVRFYAEADVPAVRADAPLLQALLLLYRTRNYLPVLDSDGALVGVLTTWDALARIAGKK